MQYRSDIDGLRAVAVLAVLFYHARLGFPGGYVGVDIFFVISGFLISGLLLKALKDDRFSFADFWQRRVRRLIPALFVTLAATAVTSSALLLSIDLLDLGKSLASQPLLLSNVYFWRAVKGGYFGDPPETRPLLHTWSLGVEEQFYLVYPLFLVALFRLGLHRYLWQVLLIFGIGSLSLSVVLTPSKPVFAFFCLPTRAWELLLGALLHFLPSVSLSKPKCEGLSLLGMSAIVYSVFCFDHGTGFPGWAAALPCLGTALVIWTHAAAVDTSIGKLLSCTPVVFVGKISYSLYLWHWPVMAYGFYTGALDTDEAKWLAVCFSLALGVMSWRWIETPFRNKESRLGRVSALVIYVVYASFCLSVGAWFWYTFDRPGRWSAEAISLVAPENLEIRQFDLEPTDGAEPAVLGDTNCESSQFLLWGDSHGMSLSPALDALGKEYGVRGLQITRSATAPLVEWCYNPRVQKPDESPSFKKRWSDLVMNTIREEKIRHVFLAARWSNYENEDFARQLIQTLEEIRSLDSSISVYVVSDVPEQVGDVPRRLALSTKWTSRTVRPRTSDEHSAQTEWFSKILDKVGSREGVLVLEPACLVLRWSSLALDGVPLYVDGHHLSSKGALELKPIFEPVFLKMEKK